MKIIRKHPSLAKRYMRAFSRAMLFIPFAITNLTSCSNDSTDRQPVQAELDVNTIKVYEQDVELSKEWVGSLDGSINAKINAQITGYLERREFHEGWLVRKGQVLYRIDNRKLAAELEKAKSRLRNEEVQLRSARQELKRIESLIPEKAVSTKNYDEALTKVEQAEAQVSGARSELRSAELSLEFTIIRSPIDGIAGESTAQIGELVGPGGSNKDALTTVSQTQPMRAYISLSELDYLFLRKEYSDNSRSPLVSVELADGTHYPYPGKVLFTDRNIDPSTGTVRAAAEIDNPDFLLKPGQFVRIKIPIKELHNVLLVPQKAVVNIQGVTLVAVINQKNNTAELRTVILGEKHEDKWIVKEGLTKEDVVISDGAQKLVPGVHIKEHRLQ